MLFAKHVALATALVLTPALALTGCAKGPATAADAKADLGPVAELRGIVNDLDSQVTGILQPINDVDSVAQSIDDVARKSGMSPNDLKAMAKVAFNGGDTTLTVNVKPEAKDDVAALLVRIKGIGDGLKATPTKVTALAESLPGTVARVPAIVAKAQSQLTVTASNPFASADAKAKAKADLADLDQLKTEVMTKIDTIKSSVTTLPLKATEAATKMRQALS
jgi:hypothetical protein